MSAFSTVNVDVAQVRFIISSVREQDYIAYEIPSEISQEVSFPILSYRLSEMKNDELLKLIKVRLLGKSIHKGKLIGILKSATTELIPFSVSPRTLVPGNYFLQLEWLNSNLDELTSLLESKRLELIQVESRKLTSSIIDRLVRDFAWTSDAIEGTMLEKEESKRLTFQPGESLDELDNDQKEFLSHLQTIYSLLIPLRHNPCQRLNVEFMKLLHSQLNLSNLHPNEYGQYRRVKVVVRGATPDPGFTPFEQVPEACEKLFRDLYTMTFSTAIDQAVWLHYNFIQVHPFRDGNGRVGRLLMNAILMQAGYPPASIQSGVRDIYFRSLRIVRIFRSRLATEASQGRPTSTLPPELGLLKRIVAEALLRALEVSLHGHRETTVI